MASRAATPTSASRHPGVGLTDDGGAHERRLVPADRRGKLKKTDPLDRYAVVAVVRHADRAPAATIG
jgi:hypothetical protein